MKRKWLVLSFILLPLSASGESLNLKTANQLYEDARLEDAARAYTALLRATPSAPVLHYNLGNTYFRLGTPGSLGRAIASYQRAYNLDPRDADIRHNLDFALGRSGERLVPTGTPAALHSLFNIFSAVELAAMHWLGFWAALLLGSIYLIKESKANLLRPWLAGATGFWLLFAGWWGIRSLSSDSTAGVIVLQDAEVRSGPGESFPVSFKLPEGRRISQLNRKGSWLEIGVHKEGLKGWIDSDAVEKI